MAVNSTRRFVLSQLVLADMIPRRTGAIVNISSGAAIGPAAALSGRGGRWPRRHLLRRREGRLERFTQAWRPRSPARRLRDVRLAVAGRPTPGTVYHAS